VSPVTQQKRHQRLFDRFSRFAGITGVPNTPTQITERATPAAIARISAMRRKTKNREKVHAAATFLDHFAPVYSLRFSRFW